MVYLIVEAKVGELVSSVVHGSYVAEIIHAERRPVPFCKFTVQVINVCIWMVEVYVTLYSVKVYGVMRYGLKQLFPELFVFNRSFL